MATQTFSYNFLLKFGEKRHMESLVKNGEIYCNTTTFFRQYDSWLFRGDSAEGSSFNHPGIITAFTINSKKIHTRVEAQLNFFDGSNDGNIYSLFGIELATFQREKSGEYKYDIDRSCLQFGEYVILITNPREFIRRLKQCLDLEQISYKIEPVTYLVYKTYRGKLRPFNKSDKFSKQQEVRLWMPNTENQSKILRIGNLSDICHLAPSSALEEFYFEWESYGREK